jgi:hypothetical protein
LRAFFFLKKILHKRLILQIKSLLKKVFEKMKKSKEKNNFFKEKFKKNKDFFGSFNALKINI